MAFLVDTNVLLRTIQVENEDFEVAVRSIEILIGRNEKLYVTPQNIREFWNVCTRPIDVNGLGLSVLQTAFEVSKLETNLSLLIEDSSTYTRWRELVEAYSVIGMQVHDVYLVAAMIANDISKVLTFNTRHFARYSDIQAVHPLEILNSDMKDKA